VLQWDRKATGGETPASARRVVVDVQPAEMGIAGASLVQQRAASPEATCAQHLQGLRRRKWRNQHRGALVRMRLTLCEAVSCSGGGGDIDICISCCCCCCCNCGGGNSSAAAAAAAAAAHTLPQSDAMMTEAHEKQKEGAYFRDILN